MPKTADIDPLDSPINQQSMTDLFINAEAILPQDDIQQMVKVIYCLIDLVGKVMGEFDENEN